MNVQTVPLDSLHADPANANVHSEEDIREIMAKLATFGQVENLIVQAKTRKVIGGNGRLEAMRRLGWTHADVELADVDNVTATAMGIALNTRRSHLDDDTIARQVGALQSEGWDDFAAIGFTDDEIGAMVAADPIDEVTGSDDAEAAQAGDDPPAPEPVAPSFTGVLRYELVFDGIEQQQRWFKFVKWLKGQDDYEAPTVAGRLDLFLAAAGPVAP